MQAGNYVHVRSGKFGDFQRELNRQMIEFWVEYRPDPELDFHTQLADIATAMNVSRGEARHSLRVGEMLRRFPRFLACLRSEYHVNFRRLEVVEKHVMAVAEEHRDAIDEFLADYFTPTHADEVLPQAQTVAKHIRAFVAALDPDAAARGPKPQRRARFTRCHNGFTRFSATLTDVEAKRLELAMRRHQQPEDTSPADAFRRFLDSKITTSVTLNTFADPAGVTHLIAGGLAPDLEPTSRQIIDHAAKSDSYSPTPEIRTAVQLLDGTCRYPGCSTPADQCDIDHVIDHDEGGETTPANLACLCRFHHNQKTSGRVQYALASDRTATWHFPNGNTKVTRPAGEAVLTPMFGQTWQKHEQRRVAKRRSA